MGRRILDQFTNRTTVSRQRRWQLRKQAEGKCMICGRKRVNARHCELHRKRKNAMQRKAYAKRSET